MALNNNVKTKINPQLKVNSIKYVKRAHMWCETLIADGKQTSTWHEKKPQ